METRQKKIDVFGYKIILKKGIRTYLYKENENTVQLINEDEKGQSVSSPINTLSYGISSDQFIEEFTKLKEMKNCSICDVQLTLEEQGLITPTDTAIVCKNHREYANYFIPEIAKMKLGLITEYPDSLKKCSICDIDLTETEVNGISEKTYLPVCSEHKIAETWYNLDLAKRWFEFAKTQIQPCEYNEENRKKFLEYTYRRKFLDIKEGDEITDQEWTFIEKDIKDLCKSINNTIHYWRTSDRTNPVSDIEVRYNDSTILKFKVRNSEETIQKYLKQAKDANNCPNCQGFGCSTCF